MKIFPPHFLGYCTIISLVLDELINKKELMKKISIISLIFLSAQLFSQTQSLAYRIPFSENTQTQTDSLSAQKITNTGPTFGKILHQGFMGFAMGVATTLGVGALIGESSPSIGIIYFGLLGYSCGEAIGIYWVGNTKEIHGSFFYTLLGSLGGTALGLAIFGLDYSAALPLIILPGVGGIIAFYLSSEEVVPNNSEAFIQIQNTKIQFGKPKIFLTRIDKTSNKLKYNFELLRVNF